MRKAHILSKTSTNKRPSRVVFVDTETYQQDVGSGVTRHTLRLGHALYCHSRRGERLRVQSSLDFYDIRSFWKWLLSYSYEKSKLLLVAHNVNFDLPVLHAFHELAEAGFDISSFYSKGMTSIFRWRRGSEKLIALDNGNFFSGKLEKWGKIVGYEKLEVDFETDDDETLLTYCQRDVEIMRQLWLRWLEFLDEHNCGDFKFTVASTAFNAYRHRFMRETIHIHDNEEALALERSAYHGGRVECLFVGKSDNGPFYYVDVNNMYGYIMSEYEYPTSLARVVKSPSNSYLERVIEDYSIIAECELDAKENWYPFNVYGHTAYPLGTMRLALTTPELILALQKKWVTCVHTAIIYHKRRVFDAYVRHFHNARLSYETDDNKPFATISKLLINSLYGKFGQRGIQQSIDGECDIEDVFSTTELDFETGIKYDLIYIGGKIIRTWSEGESYHSFPAIAAHVTAYARMYLNSLRLLIPEKHCFYMDTDSLIVDETGLDALASLLSEKRLGALKVERRSDWIDIRAPKDYSMQGRDRIKGISANATQLDANRFVQTQWTRLRGMLRQGTLKDYETKVVEKQLTRLVHSGTRRRSGFLRPFLLAQGVPAQDEFP